MPEVLRFQGLEMSQNSLRMSWSRKEVDERLREIMRQIHDTCVKHGSNGHGSINYVKGANIGGFIKVADAMMAQGLV
jgi:glutamate dehydrogenase (NADP+)